MSGSPSRPTLPKGEIRLEAEAAVTLPMIETTPTRRPVLKRQFSGVTGYSNELRMERSPKMILPGTPKKQRAEMPKAECAKECPFKDCPIKPW